MKLPSLCQGVFVVLKYQLTWLPRGLACEGSHIILRNTGLEMLLGWSVTCAWYLRCCQNIPPQFALLSQVDQAEPEMIMLLLGIRNASALHPRSQPSTQQFGDWTPIPAMRKLSGAKSEGLALAKLTPTSRQQIRYCVEL